jgi:hypothetical protein
MDELDGEASVPGGPGSGAKAQPIQRRKASLAKVREGIELARGWYIRGVIPADANRAEIRKPSLDDVAARTGVSLCTIQRRSTDEGWVAQREAFAQRVFEIENNRLLQAMADQHARARTAYFRTSMRGQGLLDRKLASEGEGLDMQAVAAAMTALGKAQVITDTAILGPKAMQAPGAVIQNTIHNKVVGWAQVSGRPSPELQASLVALEAEDA